MQIKPRENWERTLKREPKSRYPLIASLLFVKGIILFLFVYSGPTFIGTAAFIGLLEHFGTNSLTGAAFGTLGIITLTSIYQLHLPLITSISGLLVILLILATYAMKRSPEEHFSPQYLPVPAPLKRSLLEKKIDSIDEQIAELGKDKPRLRKKKRLIPLPDAVQLYFQQKLTQLNKRLRGDLQPEKPQKPAPANDKLAEIENQLKNLDTQSLPKQRLITSLPEIKGKISLPSKKLTQKLREIDQDLQQPLKKQKKIVSKELSVVDKQIEKLDYSNFKSGRVIKNLSKKNISSLPLQIEHTRMLDQLEDLLGKKPATEEEQQKYYRLRKILAEIQELSKEIKSET